MSTKQSPVSFDLSGFASDMPHNCLASAVSSRALETRHSVFVSERTSQVERAVGTGVACRLPLAGFGQWRPVSTRACSISPGSAPLQFSGLDRSAARDLGWIQISLAFEEPRQEDRWRARLLSSTTRNPGARVLWPRAGLCITGWRSQEWIERSAKGRCAPQLRNRLAPSHV